MNLLTKRIAERIETWLFVFSWTRVGYFLTRRLVCRVFGHRETIDRSTPERIVYCRRCMVEL